MTVLRSPPGHQTPPSGAKPPFQATKAHGAPVHSGSPPLPAKRPFSPQSQQTGSPTVEAQRLETSRFHSDTSAGSIAKGARAVHRPRDFPSRAPVM